MKRYEGLTDLEVLECKTLGASVKAASTGNKKAITCMYKNAFEPLSWLKTIASGIKATPEFLVTTSVMTGVPIAVGAHLIDRQLKKHPAKEKELLRETGMYEDAALRAEEALRARRGL